MDHISLGATPMEDYQPPKVETHGKVEELTQDGHYGNDDNDGY